MTIISMTIISLKYNGQWYDRRDAAPPPAGEIKPNAAGWYRAHVLPDWLSPLQGYMVRKVINPSHPGWGGIPDPPVLNGAPAVFRIGEAQDTENHIKTPFTAERQKFWADLIAMHLFGILYDDLWQEPKTYVAGRVNALMGPGLAFFNRSPLSKVRYFLTEENMDASLPMFAPLICAGMTVWVIPQGQVGKVATFLMDMPLPPVTKDLLFDPRIGWATNIRNDKTISPFPHLQGKSVPYPLITQDVYYFPMSGVALYSHDEPFRSLYIPTRSSYP